jgi:hypothetical protein
MMTVITIVNYDRIVITSMNYNPKSFKVQATDQSPDLFDYGYKLYCGNHKVLMEFDDNILLIVEDPQGILDQQLRPRPFRLLKIINIIYKLSNLNK